jgi:hypothetical protein
MSIQTSEHIIRSVSGMNLSARFYDIRACILYDFRLRQDPYKVYVYARVYEDICQKNIFYFLIFFALKMHMSPLVSAHEFFRFMCNPDYRLISTYLF